MYSSHLSCYILLKGKTALREVSAKNNLELMTLLLNRGAEVDKANKVRGCYTPLRLYILQHASICCNCIFLQRVGRMHSADVVQPGRAYHGCHAAARARR